MLVPKLDDNGNEYRNEHGEVELIQIHDLTDEELENYYTNLIPVFAGQDVTQEFEAEIESRGL